jgi:hypothetical protein
MQFAGIHNVFGVQAFNPAAYEEPQPTYYYKGQRLVRKPVVRIPAAPKPLSTRLKNLLLDYNG